MTDGECSTGHLPLVNCASRSELRIAQELEHLVDRESLPATLAGLPPTVRGAGDPAGWPRRVARATVERSRGRCRPAARPSAAGARRGQRHPTRARRGALGVGARPGQALFSNDLSRPPTARGIDSIDAGAAAAYSGHRHHIGRKPGPATTPKSAATGRGVAGSAPTPHRQVIGAGAAQAIDWLRGARDCLPAFARWSSRSASAWTGSTRVRAASGCGTERSSRKSADGDHLWIDLRSCSRTRRDRNAPLGPRTFPPQRRRCFAPSGHPAEASSARSRSCISQVWSSTWYAV
jgi:hypothetical protein